jgi:exodeoxyribonuclease VII large subunit
VVAAAIAGFNALGTGRLPRPDVLIVARGGGSIEDLMAFNEEIVVRAAFASTIPLISAVGHETDTTLIDFVSDRRAPTPTAAAEMAVPLRSELLSQTLDLERRAMRCFAKGMEDRGRHLRQLARVLPRADQLFAQPRQRFDRAAEGLTRGLRQNLQVHRRAFLETAAQLQARAIRSHLRLLGERARGYARRLNQIQSTRLGQARRNIDALARILDGVSHKGALERGFALVRGEDGRVRRRASQVAGGDILSLTFTDGNVAAVASGTPGKPKSRGKPSGNQGSLF